MFSCQVGGGRHPQSACALPTTKAWANLKMFLRFGVLCVSVLGVADAKGKVKDIVGQGLAGQGRGVV